ncbi:uncharacterized protein LOC144657030 isoform X2 [Oculina patagonica]
MAQGHRLKQSKILQLVVDYVRSSQQENKSFQQWNDRTMDNDTSYQCQCAFCEQQFEQYAQETGTFSPNGDTSPELSPESQQNPCLSSSEEELQYSLSEKQGSNTSSPAESPFEENDISRAFRPLSFLESFQQLPSKFNMEFDQEKSRERVAMETTDTPPLRALKTLCSSISPDVIPTVSTLNEILSKETYPKGCATNSVQSVMDSKLEEPRPFRLIPQIPLLVRDVPTPLGAENPGLWRPWVHER